MPTSVTRRPLTDRRSARPRAGWLVALCLVITVAAGVVVFAAAWIVGGRTAAQPDSVESLLPTEGRASVPSAVPAPAGASEPQIRADGTAQLPGAVERTTVHEVDVASLDKLKPLGWTVGHLVDFGFGFDPEHVETAVVDGVRTVELQLSEGGEYISIAETRPEGEAVELTTLDEKFTEILDDEKVEHQQVTLSTGEDCDIYVARQDDRWTATVESAGVQYVITSNLPDSAAQQVADWVMAADRARVQMLPGSPSGVDRLERGLDELFRWID
ncbi:hypothetical protein [Nesterenkonia xinjiangensis]|uniref:Uncharacterized protein n=1 Tax=Nesterenkonia xinjiangensis TaxID=225327 RepID=A0A7Z0KB25_9MICC|nr:hypothetical protein [Nesterenkonia xinjiangensis]NYJ78875.1 hypothetical protein [Nesterenkonia xinjiangensis]